MLAGAPGPRCRALLCREAGGGVSASRPPRGPSVGHDSGQTRTGGRGHGREGSEITASFTANGVTSLVTLNRPLHVSEPQFPHL